MYTELFMDWIKSGKGAIQKYHFFKASFVVNNDINPVLTAFCNSTLDFKYCTF